MSQNPIVLPNTGTVTGLALVNSINAALDSLNTLNSGGGSPGDAEPFSLWADSTTGILKQRNAANGAWDLRLSMADSLVLLQGANYTGGVGDFDRLIAFVAAGDYTLPTSAVAGSTWYTSVSNQSTFASPKQVRILRSGSDVIDADSATVVYVLPGQTIDIYADGTSKFYTRGRFQKGAVIKSVGYADNGGSTSSGSMASILSSTVTYQPVSPASLLRIKIDFDAQIAASGISSVGEFQVFETTSGNVGIGQASTIAYTGGAGSGGVIAPGAISVAPGVSNTTLTARTFSLFGLVASAGSYAVSASNVSIEVTETQNG